MKQRSYSHYCYFLTILILLPLILSACGGSSSNHEVTATQYPYGADSISTVKTEDGFTYRYDQSFEYNSAMQVVGETIEETEYDDNDGDPIMRSRTITRNTYDPSISETSLSDEIAQVSDSSSDFGAITSSIYEEYDEFDEETGVLATTPSYQREYYYSYTDSGLPLKRTEVNDGVTIDAYTYNSAEDVTSYTHIETASDGTSSTTIETYEYDSYENLISHTITVDGEVTVVDNYTHSYINGLKIQTIVDESDEDLYQIDFTYNDQEQIIAKTTSIDTDNDGAYDTFKTHTYTYDDSTGEMLTDFYEKTAENDIEVKIEKTWEYDLDGLIVGYVKESWDNRYQFTYHKYINTYAYADSGNISMHLYQKYEFEDFEDFDENSPQTIERDDNYYNDDGYLTISDYNKNEYEENVLLDTERKTNFITYTDGVLTELSTVNFELSTIGSDYEAEDSRTTALFTYDDHGQIIKLATEYTYGADTEGEEESVLTYNDDQTVTINNEALGIKITVDFTSAGFPIGTVDLAFDDDEAILVKYPNSPEIDGAESEFEDKTDDNDKSYLWGIKSPKMLEIVDKAIFNIPRYRI
ncbi:YD repeat-containing protein [Desulfuromusa kysingii]|uniref:YD repeat-containing protein n=1 Tax=Desulfuromusa kysingii TaxID=37625 RepID=A0A1H4BM67_9BACT|nr:hypothetical protein [Desulfuromusa kysingii]SEA48912.1 YD repeat-containing protein [Desulfuromusa kysingii]